MSNKNTGVATQKGSRATTKKNPYVFDPATDKVEFRMPTPLDVTERRINQYFGNDPAKFLHSNRTHRTASEAFKDADYATPIWRCENEWDRTKEYLVWIVMWAFVLFGLYSFAYWFNEVVA